MHVTNADQLADVDALLHDAAFSMADLRFDSQLGTVEISFYANPHMRDFYFRRPFRRRSVTTEPPVDRLLTISHVANISVDESVWMTLMGWSSTVTRDSRVQKPGA